ncbi:hypothetical protein V8G54_000640 [Vigna mungo]|uniref:Uncharacterized protein n=1 Tax=Vigna mungo TaxID=3915 RepID=A0AAQ3SAR4_VIGMU
MAAGTAAREASFSSQIHIKLLTLKLLLDLAKVHTEDNGVDMMTKALPIGKFEACCEITSGADISAQSWEGDLLGYWAPFLSHFWTVGSKRMVLHSDHLNCQIGDLVWEKTASHQQLCFGEFSSSLFSFRPLYSSKLNLDLIPLVGSIEEEGLTPLSTKTLRQWVNGSSTLYAPSPTLPSFTFSFSKFSLPSTLTRSVSSHLPTPTFLLLISLCGGVAFRGATVRGVCGGHLAIQRKGRGWREQHPNTKHLEINEVGAGCLTTDQKKKLLWGSKKSTPINWKRKSVIDSYDRHDKGTKQEEIPIFHILDIIENVYLNEFIERMDKGLQQIKGASQIKRSAIQSTELDVAKQELSKIWQGASELSKEILVVMESIDQVNAQSLQAHLLQEETQAKQNVLKQSYQATLEESKKNLLDLKKEFNPLLTKNLELQITETMNEISVLQEQLENRKKSDLDSLRSVTLDLDDAKESLQKVAG